eukprot:14150495-Alexandrium_andersonii.AAC.1
MHTHTREYKGLRALKIGTISLLPCSEQPESCPIAPSIPEFFACARRTQVARLRAQQPELPNRLQD